MGRASNLSFPRFRQKEHLVKIRTPQQQLLALVPPEAEQPLSPKRAFVVQFREEREATRECFTGRVEHMISGRATRFHSPEELLAFLARILADVRIYNERQ